MANTVCEIGLQLDCNQQYDVHIVDYNSHFVAVIVTALSLSHTSYNYEINYEIIDR